ncbi:hypothetical protein EVA_18973, partial [gut metagenome]
MLLIKAVLFHLEVAVLGLELLEDDARHLVEEARRTFGAPCLDAVLAKAETVRDLQSTAEAADLAGVLLTMLGTFGEKAFARYEAFEGESLEEEPQASISVVGQGSLFGAGGEVIPEAMPRAIRPGYAEAKKCAAAFRGLADEDAWEAASDTVTAFRELMRARSGGGHDQTVGGQSRAFVS